MLPHNHQNFKDVCKLVVLPTKSTLLQQASTIANKLKVPIANANSELALGTYLLLITEQGLMLHQKLKTRSNPLFIDFSSSSIVHRITEVNCKKKPLLVKAMGVKKQKRFLLDATAGFGTDSLILASLGHRVLMLERSPLIYLLLDDALTRLGIPCPYDLQLKLADSIEYLEKTSKEQLTIPDIIYLDPMFSHRTKSALNKKNMRILKELVGEDHDASKLLKLARNLAKRVVVKRPRKAPPLDNQTPTLQYHESGSTRYDVYLI